MERNYKPFWQVVEFVFLQLKKTRGVLRFRLILSIIFIVVSIFINFLTPILLKQLIGAFEGAQVPNLKTLILNLLVAYGGVWTIGQIMLQLREVVFMRVISNSIYEISVEILRALLSLSMRFHAFKQTGSIIAAIKQSQGAIPVILWGFLFSIIPIVSEISFAAILLGYNYGLFYGGTIISLALIYFIFSYLSSDYIIAKQQAFDEARSMEAGKTADTLFNIETVKYFGKTDFELEKCKDVLKKRELFEREFFESVEVIHLLQGFILGLGLTFTIISSGISVLREKLLVSDFIMINSYLLQFMRPFMSLSKFIREIRKSVADMQSALQILTIKPDIIEVKEPLLIKSPTIEVVFNNVSFEYFKEVTILKNLSFTVPAKKMTAIVGSTGSGKSTITKLLFRFYDVTDGEILINGENLINYGQETICSNFSVVPQSVAMFNDTLRYNLCYGKPDATEEDIWEAIKVAQLENFVKNLPHGFNTQVGENGIRLSGGERQRLAIARAFLKKPKLFIFDEATSALDTTTERMIQTSLIHISSGITTLVIAHRLSTVVSADQIVVLERGSIAEVGTHKSLLEKEGAYSRLWLEQFLQK